MSWLKSAEAARLTQIENKTRNIQWIPVSLVVFYILLP